MLNVIKMEVEEGRSKQMKKRKKTKIPAAESSGPVAKKIKKDDIENSGSVKKVRFQLKGSANPEVSKKPGKQKQGIKKVKFEKPNGKVIKKGKKSFEKSATSQPFKKDKKMQKNHDKKPKLHEMNKKDRKNIRKTSRNNYELAKKAKQLWEIVRCDKLRKGKCEQLTQELHNLIKGKTKELIYAHDTCRVIECLMIVGNEELRTALFEELKDEIPNLMLSKYAKFFVVKILKYGTKAQKDFIILSFYGKVLKHMKHTEAAAVVEFAYNECANAMQRSALTEEFYGPSFRLFKDNERTTLSSVIANDPAKKGSILSFMKENLMQMMTKSVVQHSLVHHVLNEFLNHCTEEDKKELIEALRESVVHILHTKDGSRVALKCIWHGSAKDRKSIVKTFKTHVTKICKEEQGHLVLLAVFENVDDTVIIQKIILNEIITNVKEIVNDSHGRKVVMHLLSPRDSVHCHPDVIKILEQGDNNPNSKKEKDVRHKELLDKISKPVLRFLEENVKEMIFTASLNIVAQIIIKHAIGDLSPLFQRISELAAEAFPDTQESTHIVEHTAGHLLLKHLIKLDKERHEQGQATLCHHIIKTVPEEQYSKWISCNRGCFVLIMMIETEIDDVAKFYKEVLHPLEKFLRKSKFKAADILLKKLDIRP